MNLKIGMQLRFGSNSMVEFDSKIPPKFCLPYYVVSLACLSLQINCNVLGIYEISFNESEIDVGKKGCYLLTNDAI